MAQNQFTEYVNKLTGLTMTQHKVLKAFAQFTDNKTGEGFPGMKTIAAAADVARSTVQVAIDDLCKAGHMELVRRKTTERGFVNVYRVVIRTFTDPSVNPTFTDTDSQTITDPSVNVSVKVQSPQNQRSTFTDTDAPTFTDRYLTDQVVSSLPISVSQMRGDPSTPKPNLISTDPLSPYVEKVIKRFARYKRPGQDAEALAREILLDKMFIGDKPEDHKTFLPAQEATIGDLATRHLIDIIGWIFEINAYEQGERVFRWADRTYTMKNLRDHLLKEQSRLFAAYADWCVERQCGYSLGTIGEAEFEHYNEKIKQRIARCAARG